jgi:leucine dehydrogenase
MTLNTFESMADMGHEQVLFFQDKQTGLRAIIAIHDTSVGPAMGATRLLPFPSEKAALNDVLRLSRGMTYKAAGANIPVGGGKGVIIASPEAKTDDLLKAYGRFVQSLNGRFITGQDVNLSSHDVHKIRTETEHVVGVSENSRGPVIATAEGLILGIEAAVKFNFGKRDLDGLKVAVQGLGNVGIELCHLLASRGVKLFVCDLKSEKVEHIKNLYGATAVNPSEIYSSDVDIFSPCALGGVLNSSTIPKIKASIIAGSANNQLANETEDSELLALMKITYCPDYIINSGGLICVYNELIGGNSEMERKQILDIYKTLTEIFVKAKNENLSTYEASKKIVEERLFKRNQVIA